MSRFGILGRAVRRTLLATGLALATTGAFAQDGATGGPALLIRNATVHTAGPQGTLQGADVLVRGNTIAQVGTGLAAPAGARVLDAEGRPLSPTLFGGITGIGIEEVSGEQSTVDNRVGLGGERMDVRPEFDVTLAYNPESVLIPVTRTEGIGWTLLGASSGEGGSIISGQGAVMRLDGSIDPAGPKLLFVDLGSDAARLSGSSRAAQWMLLDQLVDEARGRIAPDSHAAMLTPAGRKALSSFLDGSGRIMVNIDRAADIRQLLRWSADRGVKVAISGGAEAWKLGAELASADVPVFVDPLANLPAGFDQIGSTMRNAARLAAAGVEVGFTQSGDASHNARKVRQLAGNAVANGLPWEDGLAGLTSVPAEAFGVDSRIGAIAPGKRADLVLWSGDPLDVASVALQVWMDGQPIQMESRQTLLRDRYLRPQVPADQGGLPRAYPAADAPAR